MVVNRRQPAAPISRTPSTQAVPTKRPQPLPKPTTNDSDRYKPVINVPEKLPPRAKPHRNKNAHKSRSLLDRLFLFSLVLFAVYSFLVCRPNPLFSETYGQQPLLCHSLSVYRTNILEPYILPPIESALRHTHDFAKPYLDQGIYHAEPYIAPVRQAAHKVEPYVSRAQRVVPDIYHETLHPFYKDALKPYWLTAVVPRWRIYVKPRLIPLQRHANRYWRYYVSNPITMQYNRTWSAAQSIYAKHVQPVILEVHPRIFSFAKIIGKYILRAFDIYARHIYPHLQKAWAVSRPHLCSAYTQAKALTLRLIDFAMFEGRWAIQEIGNQRRTYVDPHLLRIWEQVAEKNASGSDVSLETAHTSAPVAELPIKIEDLPETVEETAESVLEPTSTPVVVESTPTPLPTTEASSIEDLQVNDPSVPSPEEAANANTEPAETPAPEHQVEAAGAAVSIAEASAHGASTILADLEGEVETSLGMKTANDVPVPTPEQKVPILDENVVEESVTSSSTQAETMEKNEASAPSITASSPGGVGVGVGASQIPLKAQQQAADAEDDLDEFLKDLGLEASPSPSSTLSDSQPAETQSSPATQQSEEDRLAAIAAKRIAITTRHTNWQAQLDSAVSAAGPALASRLVSLREIKVKELDVEGKRVLEEVQREGERLAKGLEGYLKKAEGRREMWGLKTGSEESQEGKDIKKAKAKEEMGKWDVVLQKVEDKFEEKVRSVQGVMHEWYVKERGLEGDEVVQSSVAIKGLAERAQADLGMDYAWLEDVTYHDWQRYHDLMRTSEQYEQTAIQIQNGTSLNPPSPEDPIISGLDTLDAAVEEVIAGFNVLLAGLRGQAAGVFSVYPTGDEDESNGFWSVTDGERRADDLRGVDLGGLGLDSKNKARPREASEGGKEEDQVRILPISPVPPAGEGGDREDFDASPILVGKSAEQVEQALKNAPPVEDVKKRHIEL